MCRHRAAETAQNVIFFALLAFGFYYYHKLKYFFSETFDDVILDLRVEFLAFGKHPDSNVCHAVRYVDADQGFATIVFVNRIISITCTLNDREVIA